MGGLAANGSKSWEGIENLVSERFGETGDGVVRKSLPQTVVLGEYEEGSTGWDRLNLGAV